MLSHNASQLRASRLLTLIATILVIAVLYLARVVLIPIALALLLCFLLGPLVNRLERLGLERVPSVLVATALSFAAIGSIGYVVAIEAISLAESLPQYRHNIREKARALAAPGIFSQASEGIKTVTEEAIQATTQADPATTQVAGAPQRVWTDRGAAAATSPSDQPERVEIVEPAMNPLESIMHTVWPLLGPLGTAGIVIVFVIFMLIQREDFRDRVIAISGTTQMSLATQAIDDAAKRVSRYLLMQLIVNVTYGIPVAVGLIFIGVPNALLWGVLTAVFRYIPYLGPWIGAAMPTILALAVFDDWTRPMMVIGLFIVLELISNNVIEPWLYGSGTGVSPVAVLIAAVFWGWLWGAPGLVLATPLTVCLVVLGRYIPQMQWLSVLLGDQPGLPLPTRVYQRLLAADQDEALDLVHEYRKSHSLLECYEQVLMPALGRAEADKHEGDLTEDRSLVVIAGMRELIDELGEQPEAEPAEKSAATKPEAETPETHGPREADPARPMVAVVAARDEADELAGLMLCQVLRREGRRCQAFPAGALANETVKKVAALNPAIVCISAMPPMAVSRARYMSKRLKTALHKTPLLVGVWNATDIDRAAQRLNTGDNQPVVATLADAVEKLRR